MKEILIIREDTKEDFVVFRVEHLPLKGDIITIDTGDSIETFEVTKIIHNFIRPIRNGALSLENIHIFVK